MILLRIYNFCVDIILLFLTLHYIIDKRLKMNNLTFFDQVLWIDANNNVRQQINQLTHYYQDKLIFSFNAEEAKQLCEKKKKYVIVCSSKNIQQVYQVFSGQKNCYPKFIVFCGYRARAQQIKKNHLYRQIVQNAVTDISDLIIQIYNLQQKLKKNPELMDNRIQIKQQKKNKILSKSEQEKSQQTIGKNKENNSQEIKKQDKKHKNQESIQSKQESTSQKKQKKQKKDPKKKKQVQSKKQKPKNKLQPNYQMFWAIQSLQQKNAIQKKYIIPLENAGYYTTSIGTVDDIKHQINSKQNNNCILISIIPLNVEDIMSACSQITINIRVMQNTESSNQNQEENCYVVERIQQIYEKLKNICAGQN